MEHGAPRECARNACWLSVESPKPHQGLRPCLPLTAYLHLLGTLSINYALASETLHHLPSIRHVKMSFCRVVCWKTEVFRGTFEYVNHLSFFFLISSLRMSPFNFVNLILVMCFHITLHRIIIPTLRKVKSIIVTPLDEII